METVFTVKLEIITASHTQKLNITVTENTRFIF